MSLSFIIRLRSCVKGHRTQWIFTQRLQYILLNALFSILSQHTFFCLNRERHLEPEFNMIGAGDNFGDQEATCGLQ